MNVTEKSYLNTHTRNIARAVVVDVMSDKMPRDAMGILRDMDDRYGVRCDMDVLKSIIEDLITARGMRVFCDVVYAPRSYIAESE